MFKPNIRAYTEKALEEAHRRGADGRDRRVGRADARHAQVGRPCSRRTRSSGAPACRATSSSQSLGLELQRGNRIGVGPELSLPDHPEVYVVGDIAAITDAKTEQVLPQLGSVALQSGEHAGETIARRIAGKETKPFKYRDKGTMATIGRGAAVVQMLGGRTMKGKKAQLAWGTVHLALLPTERGPRQGGRRLGRRRAHAPARRPDHGETDEDEEAAMTDATTEFFDELGAARARAAAARRRRAPCASTSRDGRRTERWLVTIDKGDVTVSRTERARPTASSARTRRSSTASRAARSNAMAALLRGAIDARGRPASCSCCSSGCFPARRGSDAQRRRHGEEAAMSDGLVKILDGNTFVVSDARGDIEASLTDPTGLFSFDTRFLSQWVLTVDGERLNPLSIDDLQYFETRFFLVPGTGTVYVDAKLSVIRQRAVGDGFHEELTILNHDDEAGRPRRSGSRPASDFADLFEVKDALEKKGTYYDARRRRPARARLRARDVPARDGDLGDGAGEDRRERPDVQGRRSSRTASGRPTSTSSPRCSARASATSGRSTRAAASGRGRTWSASLERWLADAPRLECDWDAAARRRTGAASSTSPRCASRRRSPGGSSLPAAGLPWFMTMFGRDSIFTSLQALPFTPELAATTLRALGELAGHAASTTSATRTRAGSCTRCATAR